MSVAKANFLADPIIELREPTLQGFDFVTPEYLGCCIRGTKPTCIARHNPHKLRRDTMRREQVVARCTLDIEKLVFRSDLGHGYKLNADSTLRLK